MPAQTPTDWRHEARTLIAAGYGQRETARKLGIPEDRLRKWASRAGIRTSPQPIVTTLPRMLKASPNVTAASVIQGDAERLGPKARHLAARIGHASLTEIAGYKHQKLLAALPAANKAGSLMVKGNVPGWEREREAGATVGAINIALFGLAPPTESGLDQSQQPVSIDATVLPQAVDPQ